MALFGDTQFSSAIAPPARSGYYFHPISSATTATLATLGNANMRLSPWHNPRLIKIDRVGAEITAAGDASVSKLRLVIYGNHGSYMWPGSLILDAGQINGDSATVQDSSFTGPLTLPAGVYWLGGIVQGVTTTQPTVRVISGSWPLMPMMSTPTTPTANWLAGGLSTSSVTGSPPSSFPSTGSSVSAAPRLHMRAV